MRSIEMPHTKADLIESYAKAWLEFMVAASINPETDALTLARDKLWMIGLKVEARPDVKRSAEFVNALMKAEGMYWEIVSAARR